MKLKEQIEVMIPSDKIQIEDGSGKMLYRGFVGIVYDRDIDMDAEVVQIKILTDTYKRRPMDSWQDKILPGDPGPMVEDPESYRFVDLSFDIAVRIVVDIKK